MDGDRATETHPFEPFFPEGAQLLMCGTFPAKPVRWSMNFYYPNYINDMWRVFGLLFLGSKDALVDADRKTFRLEEIKRLLTERHIALSDTGREIVRLKDNASDKFLEIVRPIDLEWALGCLPECRAIATTGEKAAQVIASLTDSAVPSAGTFVDIDFRMADGKSRHLRHWRMPSTSRAYPLKLEKKAEAYGKMLRDTGLL